MIEFKRLHLPESHDSHEGGWKWGILFQYHTILIIFHSQDFWLQFFPAQNINLSVSDFTSPHIRFANFEPWVQICSQCGACSENAFDCFWSVWQCDNPELQNVNFYTEHIFKPSFTPQKYFIAFQACDCETRQCIQSMLTSRISLSPETKMTQMIKICIIPIQMQQRHNKCFCDVTKEQTANCRILVEEKDPNKE